MASIYLSASARPGGRFPSNQRAGTSAVKSFAVAAVLAGLVVSSAASANVLHYIPLNNDPIWTPRIADNVEDPEIPLEEWIILSGLNDEDYFARSGTLVQYTRPELVPLSDTTSVFDAPGNETSSNPRATAYYEMVITELAARDDTSVELGLTDLINFLRWSEAQQTIRSDIDDVTLSAAPRFSSIGELPLVVRIYYHWAERMFTAIIVDSFDVAAAPISWQAPVLEPFVNFHGSVGGTDPDNRFVYPFVSCQVDCTITMTDWDLLECDTVGGNVDVDGCVQLGVVGNGIVDPGETCDDGNTAPGDGCDENGRFEKAGRQCQAAIGKAGRIYAGLRLRRLQKCRDALNADVALFADQERTLAIAERSGCADEFRTATKIAKAASQMRKRVAANCTDSLVAGLHACGVSVDELVAPDAATGCLLDGHDAGVDELLAQQYGG